MSDLHYERCGKNNDILCVVIAGWLDAERCDYLFGLLESLLDEGIQKLILDCSELQTISSVGIGMMVRVHARMKRVQGEVKLACVRGATDKVIALVQLDRIVEICDSVEDAIRAFES